MSMDDAQRETYDKLLALAETGKADAPSFIQEMIMDVSVQTMSGTPTGSS